MKINVIDFNVYAYIIEQKFEELHGALVSEYQSPEVKKIFADLDAKNTIINSLWSFYLNNGSAYLPKSMTDCYVVTVTDSKPYWRSLYFPEYKAGRTPKTDLHNEVVKLGIKYHEDRGIPLLSLPTYEADDLVGTIVKLRIRDQRNKGILKDTDLHLFTVDSDWLQLVDDSLGIIWVNSAHWEPRIRDEKRFLEWFEKRFGKDAKKKNIGVSKPQDLVVYKVVTGDSSDGLPPGISPYFIDLINTHYKHDSLYNSNFVNECYNSFSAYLQDRKRASNASKILKLLGFNDHV